MLDSGGRNSIQKATEFFRPFYLWHWEVSGDEASCVVPLEPVTADHGGMKFSRTTRQAGGGGLRRAWEMVALRRSGALFWPLLDS